MSRPPPLPAWALAALWAGAATLAVAPVMAADIPPLADYPAHVARIAVLLDIERGGPLAAFYRLDTFLLPNVAFDLLALGLAQVAGVEAAGRLFLALTQLLTLGGCVALGRAATGRVGIAPFVACIYLCSGILAYGFLNYLFGVAILLWACAVWLMLADRAAPLRLGVAALFALALFFAHLEALGLFAVWVGAFELHQALRRAPGPSWPRRLARLSGIAMPFVVPAALLALSPTRQAMTQGTRYHPDWAFKLLVPIRTIVTWSPVADVSAAAFVLAGAALLIATRSVALPPPLRWPLAALTLAYVAFPVRLASANGVDARVPIAIWFIAVAALDIRPVVTRGPRLAALIVGGFLAWRGNVIAQDWAAQDRAYDEIRAWLRRLPRGATLFAIDALPPGSTSLHWSPPLLHADAFAEIDSGAFVPSVFAMRGQQPIVARDAYAAAYTVQRQEPLPGATAPLRDAAIAAFRTAMPDAPAYVLILKAPVQPLTPPLGTLPVAAGQRAMLVRIEP